MGDGPPAVHGSFEDCSARGNASGLVAEVFHLTHGMVIVVDLPQGFPGMRIGDRIMLDAGDPAPVQATITGIELPLITDRAARIPGRVGLLITWPGQSLPDDRLRGARIRRG